MTNDGWRSCLNIHSKIWWRGFKKRGGSCLLWQKNWRSFLRQSGNFGQTLDQKRIKWLRGGSKGSLALFLYSKHHPLSKKFKIQKFKICDRCRRPTKKSFIKLHQQQDHGYCGFRLMFIFLLPLVVVVCLKCVCVCVCVSFWFCPLGYLYLRGFRV
jgi:hypothetical protein